MASLRVLRRPLVETVQFVVIFENARQDSSWFAPSSYTYAVPSIMVQWKMTHACKGNKSLGILISNFHDLWDELLRYNNIQLITKHWINWIIGIFLALGSCQMLWQRIGKHMEGSSLMWWSSFCPACWFSYIGPMASAYVTTSTVTIWCPWAPPTRSLETIKTNESALGLSMSLGAPQ